MNIRYTLLFFVAVVAITLVSMPVNGQTLYRGMSGTGLTLRALDFPDDSNGYVVGNSGAIVITTDGGNSWTIEPSGLSLNFYTEFFNDSANGAFAGDNGTIFTVLQDNAPIKVSLPESNPIYGMTFPSYDTGVVCGANGLFYMTIDSGKSWKKKTLMPPGYQKIAFYGTDYFDDDSYWIVGQDGLALYTPDDGATWQRYPVPTVGTPTTNTLYSIYFPDDGSSTGWIVGDQCLFLTTDAGDDWTSIPTTDSLRCVAGWDSTDAYAVGLNGSIFYTSDRSDWNTLASGTTANLYGFDYTDDYLYFCGDSGLILTTLPPIVVQPPQPNFEVIGPGSSSTISFGSVPVGFDSTNSNATIVNLTSVPDTIIRILSDSSEFIIDTVAGNQTPFVVDSGSPHPIEITFKTPLNPPFQHPYQSTLRVFSSVDSERDATLTADVIPIGGGGVSVEANPTQMNILLTSGQRSAFIEYPGDWVGPIRIEVFDVLGNSVFSSEKVSGVGPNEMPGRIPEGVYFYRLSSASGSCFGKFVFY
jgi:photosystem II stability/assembly factor-like uncharacterized protein